MEGGSVDAVVTDPPYEIGFDANAWDKTGIAFTPQTWWRVLWALKPGGYMLAFGGTRTYHRMTCAVEDAGFEICDCIMWLHSMGFAIHSSRLKPSYEPIILARKPHKSATPLNIDECRIPFASDEDLAEFIATRRAINGDGGKAHKNAIRMNASPTQSADKALQNSKLGRYPTNAGHDGSEESTQGLAKGASRYFYCAKANPTERSNNYHPTVKPIELMQWLVALVCPVGKICLDPFMGSGTTGVACMNLARRFIGIEQNDEYYEICKGRISAKS
jgi:site-specific DNA-methyltransferase (adenine-specific)